MQPGYRVSRGPNTRIHSSLWRSASPQVGRQEYKHEQTRFDKLIVWVPYVYVVCVIIVTRRRHSDTEQQTDYFSLLKGLNCLTFIATKNEKADFFLLLLFERWYLGVSGVWVSFWTYRRTGPLRWSVWCWWSPHFSPARSASARRSLPAETIHVIYNDKLLTLFL